MNILVTGGNGQLGRCIEKISKKRLENQFVFTDIPETDITDERSIDELLGSSGFDAIINCAAYTAVDKAESEPELCRKVNTTGPAVLGRLCKKHDITLIHISTDYVFDGNTPHPLKEVDKVHPTGVYGQTKLDGEIAIKESGCRAAIIRTSWLYSEFGNNFVKTMLRLGAERDSLTVVYDQVGTPTYAGDLARAVLELLVRDIKGYSLYHYSNEGVTSWYDFARKVFGMMHMNVAVSAVESDKYPTAAKRPAYSVLSKDKIKGLGIAVPYWEDSLAICLKEIQKNDEEI
ncbi:MAG: dTDP-4-dehydrorhamnose reductase [Rikenellaceae bacterium]|nr:dTDP-4-dehydrorhamnose reductase [Rikenellaceae bacterium]